MQEKHKQVNMMAFNALTNLSVLQCFMMFLRSLPNFGRVFGLLNRLSIGSIKKMLYACMGIWLVLGGDRPVPRVTSGGCAAILSEGSGHQSPHTGCYPAPIFMRVLIRATALSAYALWEVVAT